MWVARDKDNYLALYTIKPIRDNNRDNSNLEIWTYPDCDEKYLDCDHLPLDEALFPDLKWEDEPLEVGLHEIYQPTPEEIKRKEEEERIKSLQKQTFIINGKTYKLIYYENNSAPCCHCSFLNSKLECTFPKEIKRFCEQDSGTNNGWNTFEYKKDF